MRYAHRSTPGGSGVTSPWSVSAHRSPRRARGVDELVQAREAGLRVARGLAVRVLAEHAEQAPHLAERVARGLADRLEVRAALLRQALGRQTRGLGLDRDRRDVVRDDVVQVAGDARALAHRRLVLQRVDHRLPRLVALGDRLAALPPRVAERLRGDDEHEEQDAREAGRRRRRRARSRSRGTGARAAPTSAAGSVDANTYSTVTSASTPAIVSVPSSAEMARRTPKTIAPVAQARLSAHERERERREEVRDHRRLDLVGVDRHLGQGDEREDERERQRPVRLRRKRGARSVPCARGGR